MVGGPGNEGLTALISNQEEPDPPLFYGINTSSANLTIKAEPAPMAMA